MRDPDFRRCFRGISGFEIKLQEVKPEMSEEKLNCIDGSGGELPPRLRSECHRDPSLLHRVIHVMVEDDHGRILLQRRAKSKDIQPGKWDTSVGGHLMPGEDVSGGAAREFREELGAEPGGMSRMYAYNWVTDVESERVESFRMVHEGPFSADSSEIDELKFFTEKQIAELLLSDRVTPNFKYEWSLYRIWRKERRWFSLDYPVYDICCCDRCPRLARFRQSVTGKGSLRTSIYWNRPVPGFGDMNAGVLIVGLAPGAHGANRTGRPFTGDAAGDVLFEALYRTGRASLSEGTHRGDGLILTGAFITNAVKCVPPDNKPAPDEIGRCAEWMALELAALTNVRIILCMGRLAFEAVRRCLRSISGRHDLMKGVEFVNGGCWEPGSGLPAVAGMYHPSRRNINTGLITPDSFCRLFEKLTEHA